MADERKDIEEVQEKASAPKPDRIKLSAEGAEAACEAAQGGAEDAEAVVVADEARAEEMARKKRRKKIIIAAIIGLAVIAVALIAFFSTQSSIYDKSAVTGYYQGKTQEQIQQELNAKLEEGMMNVSMKATIYASPGQTKDIEIRWENISSNTMDQDLTIYLADDPSDILYKSKLIEPGQYVQYADFAHGFEAGTYKLIGMMGGYDRQTHELVGNAGVEVVLHVV